MSQTNADVKGDGKQKDSEVHQCALSTCGRSPASMRCTDCNASWYCDKQCQEKHWPVHKRLCVKATFSLVIPLPDPMLSPIEKQKAFCTLKHVFNRLKTLDGAVYAELLEKSVEITLNTNSGKYRLVVMDHAPLPRNFFHPSFAECQKLYQASPEETDTTTATFFRDFSKQTTQELNQRVVQFLCKKRCDASLTLLK